MRITVACPEALVADANHLAMCLAYGPADGETYGTPCGWQDASGRLYSCASWEASDAFVAAAQGLLTRPEWDVDQIIDMDAAARAQALIRIWSEDDPVTASPDYITAVIGVDGQAALSVLGVSQAQEAGA